MKALVTGANGMLGRDLCKRLAADGDEVVRLDIADCDDGGVQADIRDIRALDEIVKRVNPGRIFHLAAETNVDLCEESPDHAYRTNALGTENIAIIAGRLDIPAVYISTAAVFDGSKEEPYTEFDRPAPINAYGRSKWAGETAIAENIRRHFIFRAGWMVGGWEVDKKFVYKIVQQVLSGKHLIQAVDDKFGSPTFTDDFVRNMIAVIRTGRYGLYHLCGGGCASRYEIALKIVEFMGESKNVKVIPIPSSSYPLPAPRPRMEALRNYKLDLLGLNNMRPWQENLSRYISANIGRPAPSAATAAQ